MDNVLDITTGRPEPRYIAVDGVKYRLADMDELEYRDQSFIRKVGLKMQKYDEQDDWDDEYIEKLEKMYREAGKLILPDMPDEIYNKLTDNQIGKVLQVFIKSGPQEENTPTKSTE